MIRAIGLPVLTSVLTLLVRWLVSRTTKQATSKSDFAFGYEWVITAVLLLAVFTVDMRSQRSLQANRADLLTLQLQYSKAPLDSVARRTESPDVAGTMRECKREFWRRDPQADDDLKALWTLLCAELGTTTKSLESAHRFLDRAPLLLFALTLATWVLTEVTRSLGVRQGAAAGTDATHPFFGLALPNLVGFCALVVVFAISGAR